MQLLVIDDNAAYGCMLVRLLERLGHTALLTMDAAEVMETLELLNGDLAGIISDIDMPEVGGVELVQSIRRAGWHVPVVFCTASALQEAHLAAARALAPVYAKAMSLRQARVMVEDLRAAHTAAGTGLELS